MLTNEQNSIHQKALTIAKNFKRTEIELIEILQQVRERNIHLALGFGTIYKYATEVLELSEPNAYTYDKIARVAEKIPELKQEIKVGALTITNARRIAPILTSENKTVWIEKASILTKAKLEKELVQANPELQKRETVRRIQPERFSVNFSVSEELMTKLKRVQNLLSTKKRKNMNLEDSLNELVSKFLEKNDPVVKAKKVLAKRASPVKSNESKVVQKSETFLVLGLKPSQKRQPIPAATKHALYLQNNGECTYVATNGNKCQSSRWLNIHHKHHVANDGTNNLSNLQTLCEAHHRYVHK